MIDKNIIREAYSRMTDAQLIDLAQKEKQSLTSEGLQLLRKEFLKRQLDNSIIENTDDSAVQLFENNFANIQNSIPEDLIKSVWADAFSEKEARKTDEEIYYGIVNKGLDEKFARMVVDSMERKAKEILATYDKNIVRSLLICATGTIVAIWKYSSITNQGVYIAALVAAIVGIFFFIRGVTSKSKYKTILANIEAERIASITFIDDSPAPDNPQNNSGWTTTKSS